MLFVCVCSRARVPGCARRSLCMCMRMCTCERENLDSDMYVHDMCIHVYGNVHVCVYIYI